MRRPLGTTPALSASSLFLKSKKGGVVAALVELAGNQLRSDRIRQWQCSLRGYRGT